MKRLRAKRLSRGLGRIVLDEESAVDIDRVDGAGTPMDRDALGAWVGARVSKGAELGDRFGLDIVVVYTIRTSGVGRVVQEGQCKIGWHL